jgi:hypothetical protein
MIVHFTIGAKRKVGESNPIQPGEGQLVSTQPPQPIRIPSVSVDIPGVEPEFPVCRTGVLPLDDEPSVVLFTVKSLTILHLPLVLRFESAFRVAQPPMGGTHGAAHTPAALPSCFSSSSHSGPDGSRTHHTDLARVNRPQRHAGPSRGPSGTRTRPASLPRKRAAKTPTDRRVIPDGLEPASPCSQSTWVRRYPTSRLSVRTAGFEPAISWPPSRRDTQVSLRSASGPCGSRTRLCALKGRDPQSDRRTSRVGARSVRSGPGGARTLVSWSSARRYAVSATSPTKKPGVACDTGFLDNPS